jgi:hypothetical protein
MTDTPTPSQQPINSPQPTAQTVVYVEREPRHVSRPGGVTLLMVLGVIQGLITFLAGLFLAVESDNATLREEAQMTSDGLMAAGIGIMVGGGVVLLLALALGRGSQFVRWLYGIVTMVNVSFATWGVFSLHAEQRMTSVFSLVFGLVILWILFGSERTDRFFAQD